VKESDTLDNFRPPPQEDATFRLVTRLLLGLAALGLLVFASTIVHTAGCHPILDTIPVLAQWLDSSSGLTETLWLPINEHHLVWMRLLAVADAVLVGGWPLLSGGVSVLCLACLVWVPGRVLLRAGLPAGTAWAAICVLVLLVFAAPAAEDSMLAINGVYPQAAGIGMLALGAAAAGGWGLAFGLAMLAPLGNGVALVMFPILPWLGLRAGPQGRALRLALLLALGGGAFCLLYLWGGSAQQHNWPEGTVALRYAAAMLGLPISRSGSFGWLGVLSGGLLGLVGLAALIRKPNDELGRLAQGGILFGFGAAALGAFGRSDVAGGLPAVRYTALVLPLQIGVFCLALQASFAPQRARWRRGASFGLLLIGTGLLLLSVLTARASVASLAVYRTAIVRFAAGDRDPALAPYIYPDLAEATRVWNELARRGRPTCRPGSIPIP